MTCLRMVLGDQLSLSLSALEGCNKRDDIVLMCEVYHEATSVKHHQKKIALIFSAMRHFAATLRAEGYRVVYIPLDAPENTGTFTGEVSRIVQQHAVTHIVVTRPSEYRVQQEVSQWGELGATFEVREDTRFLCTRAEFVQWAQGRKQLRMEYFYREMRQKYAVLMHQNQPVGGQWNFDKDNRKPPKQGLDVPAPWRAEPDHITQDVIALVKTRFGDHFGTLEPFHFAVTRAQALEVLQHFIANRLDSFGDYQDAMIEGEPWMYHAHISFYLNCGLLLPLECIRAAEQAYDQHQAPLNAVEGFIRQILGWREYVRGIYELCMPDYANKNFFAATRDLPEFYWSADTDMNCLRQCVQETRNHAYAHHIQRLMVLGNFALLVGIDPIQVNQWFLVVYADAYEWVELPNVTGMVLFADGGYLASKPYVAGGGYIDKMSNYCQNCHYKVGQKNGAEACPFNYLYWDFLARHRDKLGANPRMAMMYRTYDRMSEDKKQHIAKDSQDFLERL